MEQVNNKGNSDSSSPPKDLDHADNVISQTDFASIEKTEQKKKGVVNSLFKKKSAEDKKQESSDDSDDGEISDATQKSLMKMLVLQKKVIDKLSMSLERLKGKFELEEDTERSINDRISELASRIGEINSLVMERERKIDKMERAFEKIRDDVHDVKPERILKMFEEKDHSILMLEADVERVKHGLAQTENELKNYLAIMSRVKSFENLFNTLSDIEEKIRQIDHTKKYTERMSGKVEAVFSELKKKLSSIDTYESRLAFLENLSQDMMQSIDKETVKIDNFVTKDDLSKEIKKLDHASAVAKHIESNQPKEKPHHTPKHKHTEQKKAYEVGVQARPKMAPSSYGVPQEASPPRPAPAPQGPDYSKEFDNLTYHFYNFLSTREIKSAQKVYVQLHGLYSKLPEGDQKERAKVLSSIYSELKAAGS